MILGFYNSKMMILKPEVYCRLEHYCLYDIKDRQYLRKKISLDLYRDGWINKIQEDSIYYEV